MKRFHYFDYLAYLQFCEQHLSMTKLQALLQCPHIMKIKEFMIFKYTCMSGASIIKGTTTVDDLIPYCGDRTIIEDGLVPAVDDILPYRSSKVTYNPDKITFAEASDARAIQLINYAIKEDKKLLLRYSGGTDSAVVLTSILKHIPDNQKYRIEIVLSTMSIIEHPYIFNKIVSDLPLISSYDSHVSTELFNDSLMIDGDDPIFFEELSHNARRMRQDPGKFQIKMPASELFNKLYDEAPFPLVTENDKMRWIAVNYFAWHIDCGIYSSMINPGLTKQNTLENTANFSRSAVNFFNSDKFFNWQLQNFDFGLTGPERYPLKQPAHDYINEYLNKPNAYSAIKGPSANLYRVKHLDYAGLFSVDSNYNAYHQYDIKIINKLADAFIAGEKITNEMD